MASQRLRASKQDYWPWSHTHKQITNKEACIKDGGRRKCRCILLLMYTTMTLYTVYILSALLRSVQRSVQFEKNSLLSSNENWACYFCVIVSFLWWMFMVLELIIHWQHSLNACMWGKFSLLQLFPFDVFDLFLLNIYPYCV